MRHRQGGRVVDQARSGRGSRGSGDVRMGESRMRRCQDRVAELQMQEGRTGHRGPCPDGVSTEGAKLSKVRTQRHSDVAT